MNTKTLTSWLVGLILAMGLASAVTNDYDCPMGGMMYGAFGGYGPGAMLFSWIIYILVITLLIAAIYWLFSSTKKKK